MRNAMTEELAVCGLKAVLKLAELHPEKISRLFFTEATAPLFGTVCKRLAEGKKLYRLVGEDDLQKLSKSTHHQGCVAMVLVPEAVEADPGLFLALSGKGENFIILDRVGNSHNLGAIVRSCAFFGIGKIVLSGGDAQTMITTSAYRIAEGGMEFVTFYRAADLAESMKRLKPSVFFIGTDHRGKTGVASLPGYAKEGRSLGIVFGNEEDGMTASVRKQCDALVRIPGADAIESLNVSVAAGIVMSHLTEKEDD